jgi:hypothetical protein
MYWLDRFTMCILTLTINPAMASITGGALHPVFRALSFVVSINLSRYCFVYSLGFLKT